MSNDISALREHLFAALQGVKDKTLDLDQARAINELGKTLVDTAKVEVDYLKVTGGGESQFIDTAVGDDNLPPGITGRTVHRLKGQGMSQSPRSSGMPKAVAKDAGIRHGQGGDRGCDHLGRRAPAMDVHPILRHTHRALDDLACRLLGNVDQLALVVGQEHLVGHGDLLQVAGPEVCGAPRRRGVPQVAEALS